MLRLCHLTTNPVEFHNKLHNIFLSRFAKFSTAPAFDFALRCARMLLTLSGELSLCLLLLP
jgi:molybdenum cofactor biosynthesis enzyme MoaA